MLFLETLDHGGEGGFAALDVREDAPVLERVVLRDDAAVALAERAERPAVLADRHAGDVRARRRGLALALRDLGDEVAQLCQLAPQAVVDVDQVPAGRLLVRAVPAARVASGAGGAGRLVPWLLVAQPRPSSGVGVAANGAASGAATPRSP